VSAPGLVGELCVLRALVPSDVDRLVEIQSESSVARWWHLPEPAKVRRNVEGRGVPSLGIERDGRLIGLIQYDEANEPDFRHAAIDMFIATEHQGQGIGTDAVRTLVRYLIRQRGHHRLTIDPIVDNLAAIRAYEKVGFRPVGVMREYWRSPEGVWRDGLLMELLAREIS
jgi:aminoglycoside 6'-N-acetyltransferase